MAVARGAGIANSHWVRDEAHFHSLMDRRFETDGPVLLAVRIDDKPGAAQPPRDPTLVRNRFRTALGVGHGGVLSA